MLFIKVNTLSPDYQHDIMSFFNLYQDEQDIDLKYQIFLYWLELLQLLQQQQIEIVHLTQHQALFDHLWHNYIHSTNEISVKIPILSI